MNLQLIFVVESNSKCKSDWIYIKDTIERFYNFDNAHVRLTPVYMDGKGNYKKKQKEVLQWIGQYSATVKDGISKVIYCFDCDDYDVNPEDICFLNNVQQFCKQQNYDFVWFCKDIERVYIGKKVDDERCQRNRHHSRKHEGKGRQNTQNSGHKADNGEFTDRIFSVHKFDTP